MDKNIDYCLSENPPQMSLLQKVFYKSSEAIYGRLSADKSLKIMYFSV